MISCLYLEPRSHCSVLGLCLQGWALQSFWRAVAAVLIPSRGLLWFPRRRQLSRLTGSVTGIIQTACPERNEATCDSVHVVKSDRREQDLEKQRSRNPNFSWKRLNITIKKTYRYHVWFLLYYPPSPPIGRCLIPREWGRTDFRQSFLLELRGVRFLLFTRDKNCSFFGHPVFWARLNWVHMAVSVWSVVFAVEGQLMQEPAPMSRSQGT